MTTARIAELGQRLADVASKRTVAQRNGDGPRPSRAYARRYAVPERAGIGDRPDPHAPPHPGHHRSAGGRAEPAINAGTVGIATTHGGPPRLLSTVREAAGLTQQQLADAAGTSQSAVAAYEGHWWPDPE